MYNTFNLKATPSKPTVRGVSLAHMTRGKRLRTVAAIAAGRVGFTDLTMQQLAGIGSASVQELLAYRHRVGAPIRPKRTRITRPRPTPAPIPTPSKPVFSTVPVDEVVTHFRELGSDFFLRIAAALETTERLNGNAAH
jgi:hypothetical protein